MKKYENPELEIKYFQNADLLTTSPNGGDEWINDPFDQIWDPLEKKG